jgi:hypothetical protein
MRKTERARIYRFDPEDVMRLLAPLFAAGVALSLPSLAFAAPSADVAKRCVHYAYIAYPFKRPGSAPMSGDRQAYIRDCFAKNGEVPVPAPVPTTKPVH